MVKEMDVYGDGVAPVDVRRRIGMVFQKPNPFPSMTIYDNVAGMVASGPGAAIESYGNNRVLANTNASTFNGTVLPLQ